MRPVGAPTTWVLSNHDVTRHATRFASPPGLGTQIATAGDLALGLRRACAATLLMRALPDSAYLYQGEELGLPASSPCRTRFARTRRSTGGKASATAARCPSPGPSYGFGSGGSWLPQPKDWGQLSVEMQTGTLDSTLELYRMALAVRRQHPALGSGDSVEWLDASTGVLVFRRTFEDGQRFYRSNTNQEPMSVPVYGQMLLASSVEGIQ